MDEFVERNAGALDFAASSFSGGNDAGNSCEVVGDGDACPFWAFEQRLYCG
jgi:hypothetical protein